MEDLAHTHIYTHTHTYTAHGNVSIVYNDRVTCRDTVLHKYRNMEMVKQAE